ncbi:TetR/AcrR family transcriptional regulator [Nocardia yamanashiensis]|uniref:TetR/AcrR family transcriptional regulator n=1 Tax=Nocardia yamanashiensis TaxID=209247 RepID=UPI000A7D667B|nr:TetR/AcrR family transcriptional regulator [Nocardia yamanashiensis]
MPRAGLSKTEVVAAGARLADEVGFANLTLGGLAERVGVRTPSLYKHVDGLPALRHEIATLASVELDRRVRDAMHGKTGREALAAFANAFRDFVIEHPGRYAATVGEPLGGPEDPLYRASFRVMESMQVVLRGYGVPESEMVHAVRTLRCAFHGYATLQTSDGFQWSDDAPASFEWMIGFIDRGLNRAESV